MDNRLIIGGIVWLVVSSIVAAGIAQWFKVQKEYDERDGISGDS